MKTLWALALALVFIMPAGCTAGPFPGGEKPEPNSDYILMATTTSTQDSGLLDVLLPVFQDQYGIEVRVLAKGTGAALELGKRGDVDVLLVHDRKSELQLVDEGYFTDRRDVMYNDFVVVGPAADPGQVGKADGAADAFSRLATGQWTFVSRGDDSGTHRKELSLWETAGMAEHGDWYVAAGQGMGDTLRMADELQAYTLTDRATYLSLKDRLDLVILLAGDPVLFNQYGVMVVNVDRHPHVRRDGAQKFVEFLESDLGRELIISHQIAGESLFFPGKGVRD